MSELSKSKHLNSSIPVHRPMGQTGYTGTANSTYETSKLASRGISAVAGLAALVGSAYNGFAQDVQPIAYKDTNLSQYGVPSVDGLKPYKTRQADLTDRIPGHETRADFYKMNDGFIGVLSIDGKAFDVMVDYDGNRPVEKAYIDQNGDGQFTEYNPKAKIEVPDWVLR